MIEQIVQWYQDDPFTAIVLGCVGLACLVLVANRLVGAIHLGIGQWFLEIPLIRRIRQWFGENPQVIALGIGVLCLLGAVALLVNPVRLLMHGTNTVGIVTAIVENSYSDEKGKTIVRSTAVIRFKAGNQERTIERSTSRELGSMCITGCYRRDERLAMLYLADDPEVVEVKSLALFVGPLVLGFLGAIALFFWRLWRSERSAKRPQG